MREAHRVVVLIFFFFQAEDGIRDKLVTGVQTCALPISSMYWSLNPFTDAEVVFHDPTVTELKLQYMDESGAWQDAWDGANDKATPRAVRITLGTTLNGRTERLPPLTVSLRVRAE